MHLYLCGFRGVGKSSVATAVAALLDRPCVDLDDVIEHDTGERIAEIFERGGELAFRVLETASLQRIARGPDAVISLGGGAVLESVNRETLRGTGRCVWLTASVDTICNRIYRDADAPETRPRLTELGPREEVIQLLERREPLYREVADWGIATDLLEPAEVAAGIARWWRDDAESTDAG